MKSYQDYQENLFVESQPVDTLDAQAWSKFNSATRELDQVLRTPGMTIHAFMLNAIGNTIEDLASVLDELDKEMHWRDEIQQRGGKTRLRM